MSKPFIIYLDIDGVLVSYMRLKDFNEIDRKHNFITEAVDALNAIITIFDAHICIVSTWGRKYFNSDIDTTEFKEMLERRGVIVNGLTFGDPDDRAGFVLKQKDLGYDQFLIIDDEALMYYKRENEIGYNRIIGTNPYRGLDLYDFQWIAFNKERLLSDYPKNML